MHLLNLHLRQMSWLVAVDLSAAHTILQILTHAHHTNVVPCW